VEPGAILMQFLQGKDFLFLRCCIR